jgi:hypothetical protein
MALEPLIKRPRVGWRDPENAYQVTGSNNRICWREVTGGTLLTATITPGTYSDLELAALIKIAMDAAGNYSYGVWRDGDDDLFYIQQFACVSGFDLISGCASAIFPLIGFTTLPRVGLCTYWGDLATPAMVYFDFLEPVRNPSYTPARPQRQDHKAYSGRMRSMDPHAMDKMYEANVRFPNFANFKSFLEFWFFALRGYTFRWWQDYRAWGAHRWIRVQTENKNEAINEPTFFKNFEFRIKLRQAGTNDGPIELEDLEDR